MGTVDARDHANNPTVTEETVNRKQFERAVGDTTHAATDLGKEALAQASAYLQQAQEYLAPRAQDAYREASDRIGPLAKDVKKKGEDAKVVIRAARRDGMDDFKKQKKAAEISEDVEAQLEDELQKLTDDFMKKVDGIIEKKTKEIMTV